MILITGARARPNGDQCHGSCPVANSVILLSDLVFFGRELGAGLAGVRPDLLSRRLWLPLGALREPV